MTDRAPSGAASQRVSVTKAGRGPAKLRFPRRGLNRRGAAQALLLRAKGPVVGSAPRGLAPLAAAVAPDDRPAQRRRKSAAGTARAAAIRCWGPVSALGVLAPALA